MNMESFDEFLKKYRYRLNEEEVIDLLCDIKTRNYVIENDDFNFLALIASSDNDELRNFYFNEQTIPYIVKLNKLAGVLFRSDFYPNKIKLFDNKLFLNNLTMENNTYHVINGIAEEVKNAQDNLDLKEVLKKGLLKYLKYLQSNFDNNIKYISKIMEKLPSEWYEEFLELILNNLKEFALKNKGVQYDGIFSNYYIKYNDIDFNKLESIINKFKGIDNLYYSPSLIYSLISKTNKHNELIISKKQLKRFHDYIFNDYCKNELLKNIGFSTLEELYLCFPNELIDYLLDDNGLAILEENNKFKQLLYNNIPYDKLTNSNLFAELLSKNYTSLQDYDNQINKLSKSFENFNSIFNLLDRNVEICDYNHFYRIFANLSVNNQLKYLKNNFEKLFKLNNDDLFKGMKKEAYEIFKNSINIKNWYFDDYDLLRILKNKDDYSEEQFESIFSNPKNILTIANSIYLEEIYKTLLNLNNSHLNKIYMSNEFLLTLRNLNNLDRIYKVAKEIEIDIRKLMLNTDSLIDIGEAVIEEYKRDCISSYDKMPRSKVGNKYFYFLLYTSDLKDKNLLYEILDFYLKDEKYLSTFKILRDSLNKEDLENYFMSRKDLITRIIKQNSNDNIMFILGGLPYEMLTREFSKERENVILYCNSTEYYWIFNNYFKGNYKLDDNILCNDRFAEKFINYYGNIEEELKLVSTNEELIKNIVNTIKEYSNMKKKMVNSLNDTEEEFKTYIEILMNSGIDVYNIEFLEDMIDIIFFNRRIKEISLKYDGQNLEKIKLSILNEIIKNSKENIVSSITNPLNKKIIPFEYTLDGETILIPTVVYDSDSFTFFVRRMDTGNHINDGTYKKRIEYYSTITEKNRSMFYGNSGVKFGYIKINPEDIIQVNSFDAVSQNSSSNKYISPYIKYPEWVSMEELNERTLQNKSYNEIRIKGKYVPDFVISYDEPNEQTIRYAHEHGTLMVKILRKSYPKAIEECGDPYSDCQ